MEERHHTKERSATTGLDGILLVSVPRVSPQMRIREAREALVTPKIPWESLSYLYVTDESEHLVGVFSIKELFEASADLLVKDVMKTELVTAHPHSSRERVARMAITHGLKAIPVVDRQNILQGVVGTDTILATLHEKHVENFLRIAGVLKTRVVTDVLRTPLVSLLRRRLPWLLIGLGGALVATLVVRSFGGVLEHELALAFFIPLIVYMSDAMGTQTQTLYIRGLAIEEIPLKKFLLRELGIGASIGLICALIIFGFAWFAFRTPGVAWTVAIALFITMLSASLFAIIITSLLVKTKNDPALGGGPFATVIQDILSLVIYFLIASALLFR
ncbi:magnesium transporter [Candidatus Uhrbacteria bacterium]|nr:magnesium transporter [Candidatus Uhrbacteria bacterium]